MIQTKIPRNCTVFLIRHKLIQHASLWSKFFDYTKPPTVLVRKVKGKPHNFKACLCESSYSTFKTSFHLNAFHSKRFQTLIDQLARSKATCPFNHQNKNLVRWPQILTRNETTDSRFFLKTIATHPVTVWVRVYLSRHAAFCHGRGVHTGLIGSPVGKNIRWPIIPTKGVTLSYETKHAQGNIKQELTLDAHRQTICTKVLGLDLMKK